MNMNEMLTSHMDTVRAMTLHLLKQVPEEKLDVIPDGFNNSIRWNFGHILYIQERLTQSVRGKEIPLPPIYEELFAAGTSPRTWTKEPPSMEEIERLLREQTERLKQEHLSLLEDDLPQPFTNRLVLTFSSVGETFLFSFYHESMHAQVIRDYLKMI